MNWNSNDEHNDKQDSGIEKAVSTAEQRWCCLALVLAISLAAALSILAGYLIFR